MTKGEKHQQSVLVSGAVVKVLCHLCFEMKNMSHSHSGRIVYSFI